MDETNPVSLDQALDKIQNWINEGETDKAKQGLEEVLSEDTTNTRAKEMLAQINGTAGAEINSAATEAPSNIPQSILTEPISIDLGAVQNAETQKEPISEPEEPTLETNPQTESTPEIEIQTPQSSEAPQATEPINLDQATTEVTTPQNEESKGGFNIDLSQNQENPENVSPEVKIEEAPTVEIAEETPVIETPQEPSTETVEAEPKLEIKPEHQEENIAVKAVEENSPTEEPAPAPTPEIPESDDLKEAEEKLTSDSQMINVPPVETINKKSILLKAIVPLLIAIILGIGGYFAYQAFSSDVEEIENEPTNDITTVSDSSSILNSPTDVESETEEPEEAKTEEATTDNSDELAKEESTENEADPNKAEAETTVEKDLEDDVKETETSAEDPTENVTETETEPTKTKVKRPKKTDLKGAAEEITEEKEESSFTSYTNPDFNIRVSYDSDEFEVKKAIKTSSSIFDLQELNPTSNDCAKRFLFTKVSSDNPYLTTEGTTTKSNVGGINGVEATKISKETHPAAKSKCSNRPDIETHLRFTHKDQIITIKSFGYEEEELEELAQNIKLI